jgi:hypothetical protein
MFELNKTKVVWTVKANKIVFRGIFVFGRVLEYVIPIGCRQQVLTESGRFLVAIFGLDC